MSDKEILRGAIEHYEQQLREMQDHVFFVQDIEGVLRRWYPPRPLNFENKEPTP